MKIIDIKNNCGLPFFGMQINTDGAITPCCMYKPNLEPEFKKYKINEFDEWWNHGMKRVQKNFLDGSPPQGCETCFDHKRDITSGLRYSATEFYLLDNTEYKPTKTPEWLDLRFGNYCNLKCIMCHADLSSQIEAEQKLHLSKFNSIGIQPNFIDHLTWWEDPVIFPQVLDIVSRAKFISFSGGEPLLTPQLYDILDAISDECYVDINTNITRLTDKHIDAFKKRKEMKIAISLDGIGSHHEYIRSGSNWKTIEDNINKIVDLPNVRVVFTYLLQHTSIYTFPSFYNFIKQYNKSLQLSTVYSGSIKSNTMTIDSVPEVDVDIFRNWLKQNPTPHDETLYQWLDMYSFNADAHDSFREYINLLDSIRNTDFCATFKPSW